MILNATFELSKSEVLDALTRAIKNEFRYREIPRGEALAVTECDGGYRVTWGEQPEDDVPFDKATEPKTVAELAVAEGAQQPL